MNTVESGGLAPSGPSLHIGLVTWQYPPATSGLPRAAREIAQSLAQAGHHVRVLTLDRDGRGIDGEVEIIGRTIEPASLAGWIRRRCGIGHLVGPSVLRSLAIEEHERVPFDVIEASNWFAPGVLLGLLGPAPLVTRNSTPAVIGKQARQTLRERLDGAFVDWLERRAARTSAALISNTAAHRERIRDIYGSEGARCHAAIAPPVDPRMLATGRLASYPPDTQPIGLLFVGRADHRKGFDAIIAAMQDLLDAARHVPAAPTFVLRLVGIEPEDLPETLRSGVAQRRVVPLGRLGDAALHAEFERAHVVLAPSRSESFGYVYQEALAYGRPVIACAVDASAREFIGEPQAGLLVPDCTGQELATAIRRLLNEPQLRARLRENALRAAGQCSRTRCAENSVALYRSVLASSPGVKERSSAASSLGRPAPGSTDS